MRILLDTNILISASRSREGTPFLAFIQAITAPNRGVICDQNLEELRRVYNRKFPHKLDLLENFLTLALPELEIIPMPVLVIREETSIRDAADRPILRAAIAANVDILLTGDKDFLESGLTHPKILTPAEFLRQVSGQTPS
jgi:putative PIN family toxin of toxin-antitoxin system